MRAACGAASLHLLRVAPAPLAPRLATRLGVADRGCLLREIELSCGSSRWIYARSVFPDSTVARHTWLADLGGNGLGETLAKQGDVAREPLECLELPPHHELARAAMGDAEPAGPLWARRTLYQLPGGPILVQEVFLPALYAA